MRFFTDQFYSEAQKAKLLENVHLIEHPHVKLDEREIGAHCPEHGFYMEWQQPPEADPESIRAADDSSNTPPTDLSAVMVMTLVCGFGIMFVFDVLLK